MADDFKVIAITPAEPFDGEAAWIESLLDTGRADRVHIRHPRLEREYMANLVGSLRSDLLEKVSIHSCHDLAREFPGIGLHFNRANPPGGAMYEGYTSASVHNGDELSAARGLRYVLASPVFDSISKQGYRANPNLDIIVKNAPMPVIALGGVTPARFDELRHRGYAGAAMLGYFQSHGRRGLQFITNAGTACATVSQTRTALDAGCRWIQIRMKDADVAEVRRAVLGTARLAAGYEGATVIVDDRVELAAYKGVHGVHLGVGDMNPAEARRILGPSKIIGMTVNTPDRVEAAINAPVDYYGVGPYRFTTTKKRLAPILGRAGVADIIGRLKSAHPDRGIVVIGGVTADDIPDILSVGADGIAVSGAMIGPDAVIRTRRILDALDAGWVPAHDSETKI